MSLIGFTPKIENSPEYPPVLHKNIIDIEYGEKDRCPSLKELAARTVVLNKMEVKPGDIPSNLIDYVENGHKCIIPDCKQVYFVKEHSRFRAYTIVLYVCASCEQKYKDITSVR
ncbi:leucine-rich repeat-containing protein 58-like [Aethina tumida]|uniref:leucine-rich repeat-containing protein 58-like n=1 Tax=Aethina tumida TaxID=116153 RepID=UPI002147AF78|nr:leucine-rich repeat-containing protein 58-like [Aethina tumida]